MPKAKLGRSTKLTRDLIDSICTYIENGMTNKDAANLSDITEDTLYRWLREADEKDSQGKPLPGRKLQIELKQAIEKSKATFKAYHVRTIIQASRKTWQASAWLLERKFPEEYASADRAFIMSAQKAAMERTEDDGLIAALTAPDVGMVEMGDEPEDV